MWSMVAFASISRLWAACNIRYLYLKGEVVQADGPFLSRPGVRGCFEESQVVVDDAAGQKAPVPSGRNRDT